MNLRGGDREKGKGFTKSQPKEAASEKIDTYTPGREERGKNVKRHGSMEV